MDQATVVQKADSSIHRLTPGPLDMAIGFPNIYPMDRDLSRGYVIQFWPTGAWLVSLTQGEERRRNIEIRKIDILLERSIILNETFVFNTRPKFGHKYKSRTHPSKTLP